MTSKQRDEAVMVLRCAADEIVCGWYGFIDEAAESVGVSAIVLHIALTAANAAWDRVGGVDMAVLEDCHTVLLQAADDLEDS